MWCVKSALNLQKGGDEGERGVVLDTFRIQKGVLFFEGGGKQIEINLTLVTRAHTHTHVHICTVDIGARQHIKRRIDYKNRGRMDNASKYVLLDMRMRHWWSAGRRVYIIYEGV